MLDSAEEWRRTCLLSDGSVFTDKQLWTAANIEELKELFLGNPRAGEGSFYEKLSDQISSATAEVVQLTAEVLWLLLLFVHESDHKPMSKRMRILEIWKLSKVPDPETPHLADDPLRGLVVLGAYTQHRWREFGFLLRLMHDWKTLSADEKTSLLSSKPRELGRWVSTIEEADARPFRHMFLYFCYPTHYEKICSRSAKTKIYSTFSSRLADADDPYKQDRSPTSLYQSLYEIRMVLQSEYETEELDFYYPPLAPLWQEDSKKDRRKKEDDGTDVTVVEDSLDAREDAVESLFLDLEEVQHILSVWRRKKNLILQGPLGVGKTFAADRLARALMGVDAPNCIEFIQFH